MDFKPTLHKLSNGVTVILDPMDLETAVVKIKFNTGSRDEGPDEYGITHFCEHMFCKGTPRFPTQRSADDFLDYNAGGKGASTGFSSLNFYGRILGENLNKLLGVLCDEIQNALFDEQKIEIERGAIADELRRALDNQQRQNLCFRDKKLFGWDVPGGVLTLGNFENIAKFSRDEMLGYIKHRMSATNCIVGISGKIVSPESVLTFLEEALSFLPKIDVHENKEITYTPCVAHKTRANDKNIGLYIYFPRLYDAKLENRYKLYSAGKLRGFILEELYEIIRRQNGLAYGFGGTWIGNENFRLDGLTTQTSPENIKQVVALTAQNVYRMYNEPVVTAEIIDRFNKSDRLGDANFLESSSKRCDKLIDFYYIHEKLYDFVEDNQISTSVTPEDVFKYSRGMFDGQMSIITFGPEFDADLKQIWVDNFK